MLYPINWQNFIVSSPLILEIIGNMYIVVICFPVYDVLHFEINLSFLTKQFFSMNKDFRKKIKYVKNKKSVFIIFKELSVGKSHLRSGSVASNLSNSFLNEKGYFTHVSY